MLKGLDSVKLQKTLDGGVAMYAQVHTANTGNVVRASNNGTKVTASNLATLSYVQPNNDVRYLEGFISEFDEKNPAANKQLYQMYEDIYLHDAICGGAVDFLSTLPFSNFSLSCIKEENVKKFEACVNRLNLQEILPYLVSDYFIYGTYVGSMNWNKDLGYFDYLATHKLEDCEIEYPPVENMSPIITTKIECPWANNKDKKYEKWRETVPEYLQHNGEIILSPASTLYIVRNTSANQLRGVSLFDRVLMVCLFEKFLLRGTVTRAGRRLAPVMHIKVGNENHVPTDDELQMYADLFSQADADPVDATIVTRDDVDVTDVKNGTDFWKWDDVFEIATSAKYRALGLSEDLLNGNTTIANMESNLSFLLEKEENLRQSITNQVFTNKIFEGIAVANNILATEDEGGTLVGNRYYDIPVITWDKQINTSVDEKRLEMLDKLEEKGIPVPLRMYAAAMNLDIDKVLSMLDEDTTLKEQFQEKNPQPAEEEEYADSEGGEDFDFGASVKSSVDTQKKSWLRNPFKRNYNTEFNKRYYGLHNRDTAGKIRYENGAAQKKLELKANREIVKTLKGLKK